MKIREYKDRDKKELIDLWFKCDLVVPWNKPELDIQRKLKVNPELFLVGVVDGKIIASIMGGYEGHRGWINYLAVDPEHRRQGYGLYLMQEVEKRLKAMGCPKINIQIRRTNPEAIKFYEAIGYTDDNMVSLGKHLCQENNDLQYSRNKK